MANFRFAVGMQRKLVFDPHRFCLTNNREGALPFLGYHHILMILIAVAIVLLCTSSTSFQESPEC